MGKFKDLRGFMAFMESRGELVRVREPVDRDLEITEIVDRTAKAGGPALLFEKVRRIKTHLLINLFGTERRMAWALGIGPERQ